MFSIFQSLSREINNIRNQGQAHVPKLQSRGKKVLHHDWNTRRLLADDWYNGFHNEFCPHISFRAEVLQQPLKFVEVY